jgi:hypothetical protein
VELAKLGAARKRFDRLIFGLDRRCERQFPLDPRLVKT